MGPQEWACNVPPALNPLIDIAGTQQVIIDLLGHFPFAVRMLCNPDKMGHGRLAVANSSFVPTDKATEKWPLPATIKHIVDISMDTTAEVEIRTDGVESGSGNWVASIEKSERNDGRCQ